MEHQLNKQERYIVGLMSGTSVDGIDAAVIKVFPTAKTNGDASLDVSLLAFANTPFPEGVRERIFELFDPVKATIDKVGAMNMLLGELYAEAATAVIKESGLDASQIEVIGSHGQTIYHAPEENIIEGYNAHCTVQIGEG